MAMTRVYHAIASKAARYAAILDPVRQMLTLVVAPQMSAGGNVSIQTASVGANYTALPSVECAQVTFVNDTGTALEVRQDGAGVALPIADGDVFAFYGLTNANQLGVRRKDSSNTQVTVKARWEF